MYFFGKEKIDDKIPTKFAFVVSKKIHKRAVVRNRIKRLMRECVRKILQNSEYNLIHNYLSVIFVAKNSSIDSGYIDISNSVQHLLQKKSCPQRISEELYKKNL